MLKISIVELLHSRKVRLPNWLRCFIKRHFVYKVAFTRSLSQARQDLWLMEEVFPGKRNGFFVEIGSADGVALSNTYLLERRLGWRGICIEANPLQFRDLIINRRAITLNTCVDIAEGEVQFKLNGLLGGIVGKDTDNSAVDPESMVNVKTVPLVDILDKHEVPKVVDYLSIDVEGAEERILSSFPFERYTFLAVSVERPSADLQRLFTRNGYILVKMIPALDFLYIHGSYIKRYADNLASLSGAYFMPDMQQSGASTMLELQQMRTDNADDPRSH